MKYRSRTRNESRKNKSAELKNHKPRTTNYELRNRLPAYARRPTPTPCALSLPPAIPQAERQQEAGGENQRPDRHGRLGDLGDDLK